ncbi:MAG: T9SS type A sorting domain-containing protein, partial [Saprospiraceae bacterium]|nr:T9SS type A sorting domain-containing protein [Saprospiraceae bacterium]
PNPFTQSTSIGFMLAKDAEATINIFDVTGKLVKGYTGSFAKGLNTITIDKGDLNSTGVLYYTLDTKEFTSTRRMVLID